MTATKLPPTHRRILFVDDDEVMAMLTRRTLQRMAYEVCTYSDARAAIDAFRSEPERFDLVVSDIRLGSISGLDLAAEVLRVRPDTPILLTSGMILDEDRARALRAGVRAVLPKAKVMTEIATVIQALLPGSGPSS